ncbi:MAG TPA: 5-deoxy-glucuronate isomerase [Candidatus Acidoferrum sp.]|nr:5-deoxy-glucuronate isomerase [Candidatus Acidoferrum sp.]
MSDDRFLVHSVKLPEGQSGELLHLPREKAQWEWMSFFVHRLKPGEVLRAKTAAEEAAFVVLGGTCVADWGEGSKWIGKRKNVFDGFPYTLYLPAQQTASFTAQSICEIAECRVPTSAKHEPKLVEPKDISTNLRGGGNASRQIVDVIPPAFAADKLMVIEVYTPGGNWSSFPPHKHDAHNMPSEADLDEIYYFRFRNDESFAFQHLYGNNEVGSRALKTRDGDTVLVRSGYHTVVAGPGYDTYYLNFLAGSARSLAATEDSQHSWIRSTWNGTDPRLPLIRE